MNVPVGVFLLVPMLRVEVAGEGGRVTDVGTIRHVLFAGQPEMVRFTVPVNPFKAVTVVVYVVLVPRLIDRLDGEANIEKSGGCELVTTRVTVVV